MNGWWTFVLHDGATLRFQNVTGVDNNNDDSLTVWVGGTLAARFYSGALRYAHWEAEVAS